VPLATIFVTSVLNSLIIGPATTKTMKDRHHQGMSRTLVKLSPKLTCASQKPAMARNTLIQARTPRQWSN
jgi:hypothetical protein